MLSFEGRKLSKRGHDRAEIRSLRSLGFRPNQPQTEAKTRIPEPQISSFCIMKGSLHRQKDNQAIAKYAGDRATKWMRWTAHGTVSLVSALFLLIGIVAVISDPTP